MAIKTAENPFGIDPARDLHHSPPRTEIPFWSENLLFTGVDSENGIFYYHHLGLVADSPDMWRGDFAVALPDGRQLLQVTYGNSENATDIGDGTLIAECIEPLKSWRIKFDGVAYLTDADTNKNNMLSVEQKPVRCQFDIRWEGAAPMHEAKRSAISSGFDVRYEQASRYWGVLRFGDEEFPLNGYGYRDHSVGPRDYSKFTGHVWHWGVFPSGKMFGSLNLDEGDSLSWTAPYFVMDGELRDAEYVERPLLGTRPRRLHRRDVRARPARRRRRTPHPGRVPGLRVLLDPPQPFAALLRPRPGANGRGRTVGLPRGGGPMELGWRGSARARGDLSAPRH